MAIQPSDAIAAIKLELGAIVVFGVVLVIAVFHWFDGLEEAVLLGGYGVGAAIWIRLRVRGLLLADRRARREGGDGPQQE